MAPDDGDGQNRSSSFPGNAEGPALEGEKFTGCGAGAFGENMERMAVFQYLCCCKEAFECLPVLSPFDHDVACLPECAAQQGYFSEFLFCHKPQVEVHGTKEQRNIGHSGMIADDQVVFFRAVVFAADYLD